MSVEDTLVKMNEEKVRWPELAAYLWVSRPQQRRGDARKLAELAVRLVADRSESPKVPRAAVVKAGLCWRGVVYAGRRSRREAAKAGA